MEALLTAQQPTLTPTAIDFRSLLGPGHLHLGSCSLSFWALIHLGQAAVAMAAATVAFSPARSEAAATAVHPAQRQCMCVLSCTGFTIISTSYISLTDNTLLHTDACPPSKFQVSVCVSSDVIVVFPYAYSRFKSVFVFQVDV